ncbi:MAG: SMC-Scp complex subunit ScpB [Bdellovibrionales bacterium]|nr:SMC-Scp complex subunit ScpB [Bdellovibrionales bacterium]
MSKKKSKPETEQQSEQIGSNEMVAFVEGASTIDIASLKASMKEDTDAILEDLDSDPELKKDVLEGFEAASSDAELENIDKSVKKATDKQNKEMAKLAKKIAKDLSEDLEAANLLMIEDDKVLEKEVALEDDTETEDMSEEAAELRAALPQLNDDGQYNLEDIQSCIEALLFYSDKPVSLKKLKEMLEMTETEDEPMLQAIELLKASYSSNAHGFEVAEIAGGYQLRTKQSKAPLLRKLSKVQVQRLSKGAMESLTIVAYKQPCTKDDIDQVRGVDSSHFIRTLMDRNLIEITGRSESAGRPMIYATTSHFLEVFNMMDTTSLPPLREIEAMVPQMAAAEEGQEDPRVVQMRKMVQQMKEDKESISYDSQEDDKLLAEIRERVKTIDITTPYLARQKALADEGITGADADEILAKEFGFNASSTDDNPELGDDELAQIARNLSESEASSDGISSDEPKAE